MFPVVAISFITFLFGNPAMAKKDKGATESATTTTSTESTGSLNVPADANSEKFAKSLVKMEISSFSPTAASSGADFRYTALSFEGDNTWNASGFVEIMDERMECTESGAWTMETAESQTVATIIVTINQTDCASRTTSTETRYRATVDGNSLRVEYR